MLRIVFSLIMVLHGLFHLVGFSREWDFGSHVTTRILNASGTTSRFTGVAWLAASVLFIASAVLYLFRKDWYWIPGAAALVISQILVIVFWNDARYATIINVVLFVAIFFSAVAMRFNNQTAREVQALLMNSNRREITVTERMVVELPGSVQRWLRRSGVVGKSLPTTYKITQQGTMRTKPDGSWMPFQATQYFSLDPPAFVWSAVISAAPLVTIAGRDKYENGRGNMVIKPMYLFEAANSSGEQVDQGTLLRYVAEMAWFPQAAVSDYLKWETLSEHEARVTMSYGGISASGVYTIDDEGRVTSFNAKRWGDFGGTYRKETWAVVTKEHKAMGTWYTGCNSEVIWKLKEGDFHWLNLDVTAIEAAEVHD